MKWKKIIGVIALVAVTALAFFKLASNKKAAEDKVYRYDRESPIAVSVDTIRLETIDDATTYTGTFEANRETRISTDIQGKINVVLVDIGSDVRKGQPLVQLDNSLLKLQLQAVEVQIEGLEEDVKRYTILTKADAVQGVQLEKAELALKAAKVQKATLLEQIEKTTIRAPFSGVVTAKLNEEGGFAAPGVPLLQITDINTLRFTVNVPEQDLVRFRTDQFQKISADAYPDISLSGRVIMTGSKANPGNSFPVQFQVPNAENAMIKSGMFGKVQLFENRQEQDILIPTTAILEESGEAKVYLIRNGRASLHTVSTSNNIGNMTVIESGLKSGDILVTKGFINLFENAAVTLK